MHVRKTPFDLIASGQKRYEIRLNDEKRRQIVIGDTLFLTQDEDPTQTLRVRVTSLVYAPTFKELFEKIPPLEAGCPETDTPE